MIFRAFILANYLMAGFYVGPHLTPDDQRHKPFLTVAVSVFWLPVMALRVVEHMQAERRTSCCGTWKGDV